MSRPPVFLTVEHLSAIHRRVIAEFGGSDLLRDRGMLDAAVAMPQARMDRRYLHGTIAAMAAAYLFHLCRNHPFVDGNKRTALVAAEVFLMLNDRRLDADNDGLERLTLRVADGTVSKAETVRFFRRHVRRARA
ncbi:MAG TPA: type II toxin-antitoxin system death-on-curing family toxin [Phycisphaerae bacterium]|nr:type II toxin-antitoxin system death-on-curing family toxin [Phycisphaerae bacterium]